MSGVIKHECLKCQSVKTQVMDEYAEVIDCPSCNGVMIDIAADYSIEEAVGLVARAFNLTGDEAMEIIKKASELGQGSNKPTTAETKATNDLQIKVEVDTSELDAAIEKAKELNEITKEHEDRTKHKNDPIDAAAYAIQYIKDKYGPNKKEKLLVIELDDIDAKPKIIFKGKQVEGIHELDIVWHSASESNAATGVRYTQSETDRELSVVYGD